MKLEKPNPRRPMLWASEAINGRIILRIFYPKGYGWTECLDLEEPYWDWADSIFDFTQVKRLDKSYGWKTHFLGNL